MQDITRRNAIGSLAAMPAISSGMAASSSPLKPRVAVVGAGAFGGWTALHLRRLGADVTLLDAWGPGNSRSSSGGETRIIRSLYGADRIYTQWVARSLDLWRQEQVRWKTTLYRRTGLLWLFATDDAYARESIPIARELGFRVDPLSRVEAEKRFPQINFDGLRSLYFEPEAGYLKARTACRTVCEQFVQEGGRYVQMAVKPGAIESGGMRRLELEDGSQLEADRFVFACGPWLGRLFPEVVGSSIRPTRQEVYYFGPPAGEGGFEPEKFPAWVDFDERLFYGFPNVESRGVKVADDTRGEELDPTSGDRSPDAAAVERARRFVSRRFPALDGAPLLEARVCQYENSPDGHFIIDRHPGAVNVWLVGGGSGHGFKLGPALGEHVAQCVTEKAEPEPLFAIERLAGLEGRSTQFDGKD